jgi:hypothetical protein
MARRISGSHARIRIKIKERPAQRNGRDIPTLPIFYISMTNATQCQPRVAAKSCGEVLRSVFAFAINFSSLSLSNCKAHDAEAVPCFSCNPDDSNDSSLSDRIP